MNDLKAVIIIGAMKCGTSSLYAYLVKHPAICGCKVKEPDYFSSDTEAAYLDLFPELNEGHKYVLDASTSYTKYPA
ncbi:MAG: hypothetical protein QF371_10095, partial [Flavobacteriales bacterium]|nr:hypothetical protein [Flavobacteriales bacterium]